MMSAETQPLINPPATESTRSTPGMRIVCKDLDYTVPSNTERGATAYLLRGVNAYFNPGQMAALIGPSGSGKTTLMDILAGRKTQGTISGTLLFANQKPTKTFLRRYAGYVEQFDTLLESLTVKEMLIYTAELKTPIDVSYQDKMQQVQALMEKLVLTPNQDKKIGRQGGLKKRVNIGIALITNPKVLFLDEPTTGVDSNAANDIMTVVKGLASDGTTICSTIHSPTPYTFNLFDRVLFLLRGEVVFFGERAQAVSFVESLTQEGSRLYDNQAEWLTAVMVQAERDNKGPEYAKKFRESKLKLSSDSLIESFIATEEEIDEETRKHLAVSSVTVTPPWYAFKMLLKYRSKKNFVDPSFLVSRIADKALYAFLISVIFQGVGNDFSPTNNLNTSSAIFVATCLPAFGAGIYTPSLVLERALFYRELDDGLYHPGIYLIARLFDEIIMGIFCTLVFSTITLKVVDLQIDLIYFWLIYFGHLLNGILAAYASAAAYPDVSMTNAMLQTSTLVLVMFCGFFILPNDIPVYWKWVYYASYITYGFSTLMVGQFEDHDEKLKQRGEPGSVLVMYDIEDVNKKTSASVVYCFSAGFLVIAYFAMTYIRHQRR